MKHDGDKKKHSKRYVKNRRSKRPVDPLIDCLILLCHLHGQDFAYDTLTAGLPLKKNRIDLNLFPKACMRAGFQSRVVKKALPKISSLVMPAILILKNDEACVVTAKNSDGTYEVLLPESGGGVTQLREKELASIYSGYSIFLKQVYNFEKRADELKVLPKKSWFWNTLFRFKRNFFQVIIASLFTNIFAITGTIYIMNVYDRVVFNNAINTLWVLTIGVCIVFVFDLLMKILRAYILDMTGKQTDILLASYIFEHVLNLRLEHKPSSIGTFSSYLSSYESLREFFTSATLASIVDIPFIILFIAIIWYIGGVIAFVPAFAVILIILISFLCEIPARHAINMSSAAFNQKHALLIETVGQLETIKTQSAEGKIQRRWEDAVAALSRSTLQSRFFSGLAIHSSTYILQMVTVLVVFVGVFQIFQGELSLGGLIACSILSSRGLAPLTNIATLVTRYQQSKLSFKVLDHIMHLPVERKPQQHFAHHGAFDGRIECRGIDFRYDDNDLMILNKVDLAIEPGEKVGIIGRVGCGKSTLLKILAGLYRPVRGELLYDNVDALQIDPAELHRSYGYVPQDSSLLYGTVRDNIATPAPWVSHERILEVAKLAGVDEFIAEHPNGYDLLVSEQGGGISTGQRQAIAIARALVHDPKILFMDEPTSSFDTRTELEFVQRMEKIAKNKTMVLVTHKKNLLSLVDRIIIVARGRIIIDGKRDEVMKILSNQSVAPTGDESYASPPV